MDGFDRIREKWSRLFHVYTREPDVVHSLDMLLYNMASIESAGPSISELIEMAAGQVILAHADVVAARFGKERYHATVDEFVEAAGWFLLKYPRLFHQRWENFFNTTFSAIDMNKDGMISLEEFSMWNRGSNLADEMAAKIFTVLDTYGDGIITKEEFVKNHLRYFCDPDFSDKDLPLYG